MDIYVPYTYLIGWSKYNKFYYGRRTAKNCNPTELWKTYFTSSKYVKQFRKQFGEPDIFQIRKTFQCPKKCALWECKVLEKIDAQHNDKFLNQRNGDYKWDTTGIATTKGRKVSDSTKKLLSEQRKGKKSSEATKNKLSKFHKQFPPIWLIGKPQTEEHKRKNSIAQKNRKRTPCNEVTKEKIKHSALTNQHKGVGWSISRNKWRAYKKVNGKMLHLGYFYYKIDAIQAVQSFEETLNASNTTG